MAVFVLSIGLLGTASLQIIAKKANYDAVQRTTAAMLANDIIERMRTNVDNLADYEVAIASPLTDANAGTEPVQDCSSSASGDVCTPTQLAAHDLWEWQQAIIGATDQSGGNNTGGLAQPAACIIVDTTTDVYTVAIAWLGKTALSNPTGGGAAGYTCGENLDYGASDEYRRIFVISTFIQNTV